MQKELKYLFLLLLLFVSCEQIYQPAIDHINGQLVVEALITNDLTRNYVQLTRTRAFNDQVQLPEVSGATVQLIETGGGTIQATESTAGLYVFNSAPVSGNSYKLRIIISPDTYESEVVTMPPLPTITNVYTTNVVQKTYVNNGGSVPEAVVKDMREIDADLPVTNSLAHYRFDVRSILEWTWDSIPGEFHTAYGWYSYNENNQFILAGTADFSQTNMLVKQPLLTVSYNALDYLYSDTLVSHGWILVIEQYGTSAGSYNYHQQLNSQFAAKGSLFDPIQTQIYGNITCKTDSSKIAYGYFDLNSCQQVRYYFNLFAPNSAITLRQLFRYPDIPDHGVVRVRKSKPTVEPPPWWEE